MIVTKNGKGLRFSVDEVRLMGRVTHGVRGIKLSTDDEVVSLLKVNDSKKILIITESGRGKQVEFNQFMAHHRGTGGQTIYKIGEKTSYIVTALSVDENNDLVCITRNGITIRTHVKDISTQGRAAQGVTVVKMKTENDKIVSICSTVYQEDEEAEQELSETEETGAQE